MPLNLFSIVIVVLLCFTSNAHAKDDPITVVVGAPFIELQLFPGRGYPKFHAVEKHQIIKILKSRAGWYLIATEDGIEGWVRRRDLEPLYALDGTLLDFSEHEWHEAEDPWQLALLGGKLDGDGAYNIMLGYRFTPNLSAELKYTQAFGDYYNVKLASAHVVHQAFPKWRISPFFTLGAGVLKTFPDAVLIEAEDREDSVLTVGTGLFVYLHHKVIARLEYNKHTVLTTQDNNDEVEEWKAGLSVLF